MGPCLHGAAVLALLGLCQPPLVSALRSRGAALRSGGGLAAALHARSGRNTDALADGSEYSGGESLPPGLRQTNWKWERRECDINTKQTKSAQQYVESTIWNPPGLFPNVGPFPVALEGKQWCSGTSMRASGDGRVALLLTGQAFRARDFFTRRKYDCLNASVPAQKKIVGTHFKNIIKPIEALGFAVDVFLSITPCSEEPRAHHLEELKSPEVNSTAGLLRLYGESRVKGVFRSNASHDMYANMADAFLRLDKAAAGTAYDYFVVTRFDVAVDMSLTNLIPDRKGPHQGLTFFTAAHDFFFSFPGELWNCMKDFWDGCMRLTNNIGPAHADYKWRRSIGCFDLGPVHTPDWAEGHAYDWPLMAIGVASTWTWAGSSPKTYLTKWGTTGFDKNGRAHRCRQWFWPPKSSWEHGYMPYMFHLN